MARRTQAVLHKLLVFLVVTLGYARGCLMTSTSTSGRSCLLPSPRVCATVVKSAAMEGLSRPERAKISLLVDCEHLTATMYLGSKCEPKYAFAVIPVSSTIRLPTENDALLQSHCNSSALEPSSTLSPASTNLKGTTSYHTLDSQTGFQSTGEVGPSSYLQELRLSVRSALQRDGDTVPKAQRRSSASMTSPQVSSLRIAVDAASANIGPSCGILGQAPCASLQAAFAAVLHQGVPPSTITVNLAPGVYDCANLTASASALALIGAGVAQTIIKCHPGAPQNNIISSQLQLSGLSMTSTTGLTGPSTSWTCPTGPCRLSLSACNVSFASAGGVCAKVLDGTYFEGSLINNTFYSNSNTAFALTIAGAGGLVREPRVVLSGNTFSYNQGGAVAITVVDNSSGGIISSVSNTFVFNSISVPVGGGRGAGMAIVVSGRGSAWNISLSGDAYEGNENIGPEANFGGAVSVTHHTAMASSILLDQCVFVDNSNTLSGGPNQVIPGYNYGGAVSVYYEGPSSNCSVSIQGSILSNNSNFGSDTNPYGMSDSNSGGALAIIHAASALLFSLKSIDNSFTSNSNLNNNTFPQGVFYAGTAGVNMGGAISMSFLGNATSCSVLSMGDSFSSNANTNNNYNSNAAVNPAGNYNYGGSLSVYVLGSASSCVVDVIASTFSQGRNTNALLGSSFTLLGANYGGDMSVFYNSSATNCSHRFDNVAFSQSSNEFNLGVPQGDLSGSNYGGALSVYFQASASSTTTALLNATFADNSNYNNNPSTDCVSANYGGAISVAYGDVSSLAQFSAISSTFATNVNTLGGLCNSYGGAVSLVFSGNVSDFISTTTASTFTSNKNQGAGSSNFGGAMSVLYSQAATDIAWSMSANLFNSNINSIGSEQLDGGSNYGGAVSLYHQGPIANCTVISNTNTFLSNVNTMFVRYYGVNCGGALSIQGFTFGSITFVEDGDVFIGNSNSIVGTGVIQSAGNNAGALYVCSSQGATSITRSNFDANTNFGGSAGSSLENVGGAASIQGASLVVSSSRFNRNANSQVQNFNNCLNVGGALYGNVSSVQLTGSVFLNNTNYHSDANLNNENNGAALDVLCASPACAIDISTCAFDSNSNNNVNNHQDSSNTGADLVVGSVAGLPSCYLDLNVTGSHFMRSQNNLLDAGQGSINQGGLLYVDLATVPESSLVAVFDGDEIFMVNNSVSGGQDALNQGAMFFIDTSQAPSIRLGPSTTIAYANTFPTGSLIVLGNRSFSTADVCGASSALAAQGLDFSGQCDFTCPPGRGVNPQWDSCVVLPSGGDNGLTVGQCAGVGIGVGLGMLLMIFLLGAWSRWLMRRSSQRYSQEKQELTERLLTSEYEVTTLKRAWEIPWEDIDIRVQIGHGAFGTVHSAVWRDLPVAVKTVAGHMVALAEGGLGSISSELDKEIAMLQTVRHNNIVLFFGAGTTPSGTPFLVTELMDLGTLGKYLADHTDVPWARKVSFALDTAQGMAHVHSLGRMHRDLKSGNLLISASLRVKVADFGTATITSLARQTASDGPSSSLGESGMTRLDLQRTKGVGTPLWMAPELLMGRNDYGPPADVYSFGIVMWEIAAQDIPWKDIQGSFIMDRLFQTITSGERPPIDSRWPQAYTAVMQQCWATAPAQRGSFAEAVAALMRVRRDLA